VDVHHDPLDAAFAAIDRRGFLPPSQRPRAGEDRPLGIGHEQTSSQPTTVRSMLALLDVQPGQRVLDVGAGSGWTTALLGHLVGPTGTVIGVERVPELAAWGAANVAHHAMPWATERLTAPDELGVPAEGPYDRILVSAMADEVPDALVAQLAPGGRLVIPVRSRMLVVDRHPDGSTSTKAHGWYSFVPLITP
jgi:protein-L-isoaspartate(D-aspartate) O-methyltransferase